MRLFFTLFTLLNFCAYAQFVSISDTSFRNYLMFSYPSCFNNEAMLDTTCSLITEETHLSLQLSDQITTGPYQKIEGLQYFKSLKYFLSAYITIEIGQLPPSLRKITHYNSTITHLFPVPDSITHIEIHGGRDPFPIIPLPNQLSSLYLEQAKYTSIPTLPQGLDSIYCVGNEFLNTLPELPDSLTKLVVPGNALTSLPKMPYYIEYVEAEYNCFDPIPKPPLSTFLKYFHVTPNNPQCTVTGVKYPYQHLAPQLYPVLVKDILNISGMEGSKHISIFSGKGNLERAFDTESNQVDLSELATGLYYITLMNQKHQHLSQKIIKE